MPTISIDPSFLNIPISDVYIGEIKYPLVVRECSITRYANEHDVATLSVVLNGTLQMDGSYQIPIDETDPTGASQTVVVEQMVDQPIKFTYGINGVTETFTGYVTAVTPNQRFKQSIDFQIDMTGASFILQQVTRRMDTNKTIPELIQLRTEAAGLTLLSHGSNYRWQARGQSTETDWEFICNTCLLIGYIVFTWGPVIRVCDPLKLMEKTPYRILTTTSDVLEDPQRSLMDFQPTETSPQLYNKQGLITSILSSNGDVTIQKGGTGAKNYIPVTFPILSVEQGREVIAGVDRNIERWTQQAEARIKGDASIYPGMTVTINTGQASASARYNGRWLVIGVEHSMTRTTFNSNLTLGRPVPVPTVKDSGVYRPFWDEFEIGIPTARLLSGSIFNHSWSTQYKTSIKGV
jgi:hypothetical protein